MINNANAAQQYRKKPLIAGFSFGSLDTQPDRLTDASHSSSLPEGNLVQGEAQRSLTLAVARKKRLCHLKMQRKGKAIFSPHYLSQNKY